MSRDRNPLSEIVHHPPLFYLLCRNEHIPDFAELPDVEAARYIQEDTGDDHVKDRYAAKRKAIIGIRTSRRGVRAVRKDFLLEVGWKGWQRWRSWADTRNVYRALR